MKKPTTILTPPETLSHFCEDSYSSFQNQKNQSLSQQPRQTHSPVHGIHFQNPLPVRQNFRPFSAPHLDPELLHGVRREQRPDGGLDGPLQAAHHDGVPLVEDPVHQHHVDGRTQPLDHLHLQDRAL